MNQTLSSKHNSRLSIDDPIVLLKNEHTNLLGQIHLLESHGVTPEKAGNVLKTLLRDSQVHFKREAIVLEALGPMLGAGGESLEALKKEHRQLKKTATTLLKHITRLEHQSKLWGEAHLRPLLQGFTKQFRSHIQHEEKVVYVLVRTRLTLEQQGRIAHQMLTE
ncbi:MAG: hemerythrin domain-containing protein [Nitrospirales bacterium]|nr:hemerythrin domain-containing protein [Nitrospirales bacterium]